MSASRRPAHSSGTSPAGDALPMTSARSRRSRSAVPATPLGSLTQSEQRVEAVCAVCGSHRVTRLSMTLTDGTPVAFTSCHRCENRSWQGRGDDLSVDDVLDRARKPV